MRLSRLVDEGTSPERQREQIQTWAKLHGHTVVHITEDTDVSGAIPARSRPELGPWLTDRALSGRWQVLCAAKLDRVTRSVSDLCDLIEYCQANGKTLVSIAESFDLSTAAGRMVAPILASVAAFERERTAERRREAADWLRRHGRYGGGVIPFGYQPEQLPGGGWQLVPDPEQARHVRRLADEVIRGRTVTALCEQLTERGVPTSRGGTVWHNTSLSAILRSPILIGQIPVNGQLARDEDGVVVRRQPILSDELWAKVQAALSRASQVRTTRRSSPLIGVLSCALCQQPMYLQRRSDRPTLFYRCGGKKSRGCRARFVPAAEIEDMITSALLEACGDVDMADEFPVPHEDHTAELAAVEEALEHFEDQLVAGQVSAEAWGRAVARLEKRQAELRQQQSEPAPEPEWIPTGKTFEQTWDDLDENGRRALLQANGITAAVMRKATVRAPSYPAGDLEEGHILMVTRRDIVATVNLGKLAELRARLAQLKPA